MKFSKRLQNTPEYIFLKLAKKVAEVENKTDKKVLNLGIGSPTFPPSKIYINKLKKFIDEPDSHLYPGYGAIPEFSAALITWYKSRFDVNLSTDEIYPLLGAKDGISHLPLAMVNEGDEVLIPDPGYPAFSGPLLLFGAQSVTYDLNEKTEFKIDFAKLEKKISKKTKIIWVNFPSNPTGQTATLAELKKLVDLCRTKNIIIIYDNVYSEITFDQYIAPSILQIERAREIAVEIGSFSKSFSFAGYRMAWIAGNRDVVAVLANVKSQMDTGMSIPLQKLGAFALTNFDKKWNAKMIAEYRRRRKVIAEYLKMLNLTFILPKAGLYIWAKIPDNYKNSDQFCFELLENKQVLLTPGSAFGKNGEQYVRVSVSSDIENISKYY